MADTDHLDALSNAELRAQMLAQGLPNIPVTDSSRKVLVRRLRASLGGDATLTGSPKKTSNRRETLQPAATAAAATAATAAPAPAAATAAPAAAPAAVPAPTVDKRDAATSKTRRSIAVTPNDAGKEADRRRKPSETAARVPEASQTTAIPAPKATVPIQSRRISNSERRVLTGERGAVNTPATIAEIPTTAAPKQRSPENILEVNSLIVLESDEEEDEQLAQAAQQAENQVKHTQKVATSKLTTSKLTTTSTNTHQYAASKPSYRAPQVLLPEPQQRRQPIYESQAASIGQTRPTYAGFDYTSSGRYDMHAPVSKPSYSATSATIGASNYRRSPPRTYANEFSDDTAEDEETIQPSSQSHGAKFESDFARKLATLRAEKIGDRTSNISTTTSTISGTYNRISAGRTGKNFEPVARRSLRPDNVSVSVAFARWYQSLDRQYNLKPKLFVLFVLVLIYFVYKFYY